MKQFWLNQLLLPVLLLTACTPDRRSDVPVAPSSLGEPTSASSSSNEAIASTQLHVRDFGATPGSSNIFQALENVVAAAKAVDGPVEVLFEPDATYRIALPNAADLGELDSCYADQYAWHIQNATNLVINGQGATLLITNPEIGGICMEDSSHMELKNFRIDYATLPYTQGTITKVNAEEYWYELKLDEGYPEPDTPNFEHAKKAFGNWGLTIRDEGNGRVRYGPAAIFSDRWERTAGDCAEQKQSSPARIWRFFPSRDESNFSALNNPLKASGLKPGDRFVHMARNWSQAVAGRNCDHMLWEGITIYAAPGLAFFPRGTSHHTIRDCHVKLKDGRIFSTTSDGIHMRGARGHMLMENCSFEGMADDGINVHSSALSVVAVPAPDQVAVNKHTFSVRPGDELIQVRPASAKILGKAIVTTVEDQGGTWLVTLNGAPTDVTVGDNFYNLSESAAPFVIRNCHFKNYRGRGVLVSAHGGVIENCTFEQPEGWSVVLHYESTRWSEGPLAYDLQILNNIFLGKGSADHATIRTEITTRGDATVDGRPFHDILIEGNRFYDYGQPVIDLHHVRNVTIRDNRIFNADETPRKQAEYAAIELFDSENITIEKLAVEDRDPRQVAAIKIAADCGENIEVDTESLKLNVAETCKPVLDQRAKQME